MTPKQQELQAHIDAIAKILYENTPAEELKTLGDIEQAVRRQTQEHVLPQLGFFLSKQKREPPQGTGKR